MLLLFNGIHEKASQKIQTDKIYIGNAIYTLHLCSMKNVLVFSQSEALDVFMWYYILIEIKL